MATVAADASTVEAVKGSTLDDLTLLEADPGNDNVQKALHSWQTYLHKMNVQQPITYTLMADANTTIYHNPKLIIQKYDGLSWAVEPQGITISSSTVTTVPEEKPSPPPEPEPEPTTQVGFLIFDSQGYAQPVIDTTQPLRPQFTIPQYDKDLLKAIHRIYLGFGPGRIVGRGHTLMPKAAKREWLQSWLNGDLKRCYDIEAAHTKPSPQHPGGPKSPQTHRIFWQPAVPGEIPAGVPVPGSWTSPDSYLSAVEADNYVIAAKAQHTNVMSLGTRREWARAHIKGDKPTVDAMSLRAKERSTDHWLYSKSDPTWNPHWEQTSDFAQFINDYVATNLWTTGALHAYAAAFDVPKGNFWHELVANVDAHRKAAAAQAALDAITLKFTLAPEQPDFGGYHRKQLLVDQHDRQWLFKPAADEAHRFRPEVEHAAHRLAQLWGYGTAESRLIEFDGAYGQVQRMLPVDHALLKYSGAQFATLTKQQLCAIAKEHILDWAIDNDDAHGDNVLVLTDGSVVGIDKGRAWRYFGGWDGLSANSSADSNAPLVYTALYNAIRDHHIDRATVDAMYRAVLLQARRMQQMSDATLREIMEEGLANRPHYSPSWYQKKFDGAPTNLEELITAATARKHNLVADMDNLWQRIYEQAGWERPEINADDLTENAQGHPLYSGLHAPGLHEAVMKTKSYGTATFVAGTDIEDAHILLWREKRADGPFNIRGQFKVRTCSAAFKQLTKWFKKHAQGVDLVASQPTCLPNEDYVYNSVIATAKHVSLHAEDRKYSIYKLQHLQEIKDYLEGQAKNYQKRVDTEDDPAGYLAATVEMTNLYLEYITTVQACKTNRKTCPEGFPRYVFEPIEPQPAEPNADGILVERRPLTRAAAHLNNYPELDKDGELQLGSSLLNDDYGQQGLMYLVTLPTGEEIEFRAAEITNTDLTSQGMMRFTIKDADALAESLHRIQDQLAEMGLELVDAGLQDMELFYWRHLAAIMADRVDSAENSPSLAATYQKFWEQAKTPQSETKDEEIERWRTAFASITSREQIERFICHDGHLPRFMHMDLRQPNQPCGKPYWERFDVTDEQWKSKRFVQLYHNNGPAWTVQTGVTLATEARSRVLAIWKAGGSSVQDCRTGAADFVFTRQNRDNPEHSASILYSPRVLRRTSTYTFPDDNYGKLCRRRTKAYFDFNEMTKHTDSSNEALIKDAMSVLDDAEIMIFRSGSDREAALAWMAKLGITEIREIPVAQRFIMFQDTNARDAIMTLIRKQYARGTST